MWKCAGLMSNVALLAKVRMRYLNTVLGLLLHVILILLAYVPLFVRCIDSGLQDTYPVIVLFSLLSLNEILLSITPPSVMVLPVCTFTYSMVIGFFITQVFPWIYPFLIMGLFIFVLGLLLQFVITLVWFKKLWTTSSGLYLPSRLIIIPKFFIQDRIGKGHVF